MLYRVRCSFGTAPKHGTASTRLDRYSVGNTLWLFSMLHCVVRLVSRGPSGLYPFPLVRTFHLDVLCTGGGFEMRFVPFTQNNDQGKRRVQRYLPPLVKVANWRCWRSSYWQYLCKGVPALHRTRTKFGLSCRRGLLTGGRRHSNCPR